MFKSIFVITNIVILSLGGGRPASGPTGVEILKKAAVGQKSIKSYQSIITMNSSSKSLGSMIMRMDFKSVPGKKYFVKSSVVGTPTGQFAMLGSFANSTILDDGKYKWTYNAGMKSYSRSESMITKSQSFNMTDLLSPQKPENLTVMGVTNIDGKPAYAVRSADPKDTRKIQPMTTIYVDRENYRVRRMEMTLRQPSMDGKSSEPINIVMNVESEKVNLAIPDSTFKFTPPPGAKEMAAGMGGGMMGMPGMLGGKTNGTKKP